MSERASRSGAVEAARAMKVAQISTPQAGMTSCARCNARWGGLRTAHCDACHETFTVVAAFDKHRAGSHTDEGRHCIDPAAVGLVDMGRAYPCWGFPGRGEDEAMDACPRRSRRNRSAECIPSGGAHA